MYTIPFDRKEDLVNYKILDTLNFNDFTFYARDEFYTYPGQQHQTKVGIHYLLIEKSNDSTHRVLSMAPLKPFRSRLNAPQYESNFDKVNSDTVDLASFIVFQMGILKDNQIEFLNNRKKRTSPPTYYIDTTNTNLLINEISTEKTGRVQLNNHFKNGVNYRKINQNVIITLNPTENCNISVWAVDNEFYVTDKNILFQFLLKTCDNYNYFSFKRYQD
ncbi:hypothetical protein [Sphingobacterium hungaricum]